MINLTNIKEYKDNKELLKEIKEEFKNSSDLIIKTIKDIDVIFLESLCSSDKINEYILKVLSLSKKKIKDSKKLEPFFIKTRYEHYFHCYSY